MKKMLPTFDYIFYRIYRFFNERGDTSPETAGTVILSLIQFFTLLDIVVFVRMVYPFPLPPKLYFLPVIALPAILNWFRYERRFDINRFDVKWKDEEESKKVRNGWFIGMYLLISFLILAVYGYLAHNLKII